jgi:hypothetical protein
MEGLLIENDKNAQSKKRGEMSLFALFAIPLSANGPIKK